jgi:hypothetical protein
MTYTKDDLIEPLRQAVQEDGRIYEVLNDNTNSYPTAPTYYKHFGSMDAAFEEAGLERRDKWQTDDDRGHDFPIRDTLSDIDGYDADADGWVYIIRFE